MLSQVGLALDHALMRLFQNGLAAVAANRRASPARTVQHGVHLRDKVETIEDVDGLTRRSGGRTAQSSPPSARSRSVDQRQVFVTFGILDFMDADGCRRMTA
jgi:hypothetical protein